MRRADAALDLISNVALAGAVVLLVVRPRMAARPVRSPLVPNAQALARSTARHLIDRPVASQHSARNSELARFLSKHPRLQRREPRPLTSSTGRCLNGGAAILALSVLADSAVEHYRGSFANRAMYTPLVAAALTLGASLFGSADARAKRHVVRDTIYTGAAATGLAGLGFHAYNILKRPGGASWSNVFYAAPIGAPAALMLAGLIGRGAERVRDTPARQCPTVLGLPAGRMLAVISAAGLAGTVGEAGLLHFRGAYHNPAMLAPVTVPPVAAVFLGAAALRPSWITNRLARSWLGLTALLGFAGIGFHAYGVSRNMGGWRNWSQNVLNGPPLPAPPSFTGLALAGLAALKLIEEETDA